MRLTVRESPQDDVFQDRVRVHYSTARDVGVGRICKLTARGRSVYVEVRPKGSEPETIRMDRKTRTRLGVKPGDRADFALAPAGWWGQAVWTWNATDPRIAVPARLGIVSFLLGILSTVLAIWTLR